MNPDHKARILVVEDHAFVREGIVRLINSQKDLTCCGEKNEFPAGSPAFNGVEPDLILVDIPSKDDVRFETLDILKLYFPQAPVVVLSESHDGAYVKKVLRAGASGYVMREDAPNEMIDAIRTALDGGKYVSHTIADRAGQ